MKAPFPLTPDLDSPFFLEEIRAASYTAPTRREEAPSLRVRIIRHCVYVARALFVLLSSAMGQAQREQYNFNGGWKLLTSDPGGAERAEFNDSGWQAVNLPHAWNEDYAYRVSIHDEPIGIAWYRKHFRLPATATGNRVFVEFQGVRQAAEVYLNGVWLGRCEKRPVALCQRRQFPSGDAERAPRQPRDPDLVRRLQRRPLVGNAGRASPAQRYRHDPLGRSLNGGSSRSIDETA
jgi:hypothetical protein